MQSFGMDVNDQLYDQMRKSHRFVGLYVTAASMFVFVPLDAA